MNKSDKKKSTKMILAIILFVIIVGIVITAILMNNKDNKHQEEKQKDTILLKDNLKFEINSEVTLLSLVSKDNKVKVLSEDETIDTSTLGEKEILIKYEVEEKEETKTFKIIIEDTQAPTIEFTKELSTNVGTKIDLLKDVKVSDNSKEKIKATVEGNYNFDKEGTYNLKYVAVDSSNNKKEEEFTLKVNKKTTASNNNNNKKPQTNNNTNYNEGMNITDSQAEATFNKYYNQYKNKYTTKPENFSPEKYVTIKTSNNPVKFHYEWFVGEQKWQFVADSFIDNPSDCQKIYPAPNRSGKESTYEENGITYYMGEKTQTYSLYFYIINYDDGYHHYFM